ncbi:KAP family NTPase [[Clostridium] symbiosum]|uniref:P-loop NTPase fold protein n=1 Tax=Clostridium symbiosum TaxID=1512 RepID=UPI00210DF358|nr:P-loop NTPase fold protein [[Clostridium] symbiosum]MCQ4835733.1 KAP family NTPase [[Clostridium] symbiosum]
MVNKSNQNNLTDDEIVEAIISYVDEDLYSYAVLIDGEWGCGKTYFIKEYLCDKLEDHEKSKAKIGEYKEKRIVYLSLYGVKSVDEVSKQILLESYLSKTGKIKGFLKKGTEVTGKMLPVLFDIIKAKGLELDVDNVSNAVGGLLSVKDSILIFDDLERCDCPINEILGYINTFVEHNGMKVILIANQKEIGKSTYLINQELKYLVAAHKNIVFEEKTGSEKILETVGDKKAKEQEPVELSAVKSRMDKLFGQNELYEKVKEKLVGVTIYYYPALQEILTKLIKNKSLDDELQKLLSNEISFFKEVMVNEEHPNLRTFQFFLSKVSDLYEIVRKFAEEGREAFIQYIIKYSFKVCVCYKNGTLEYNWEGNEEYGFKNIGKADLFGSNLTFRFVDDFVVKSVLDEERVKKMFEVYVDEYIKPQSEYLEAFKKLEISWHLSTDDEVENQLEEILIKLGENKYDVEVYARIISLLIDLEEVGFSKDIMETAISKMRENIDKLTFHMYLDSGYCSGSNDKKKERFKRIINELQDRIDRRFQEQVSKTIGQYLLMGDGWADNLVDYVRNRKREINNNSGFLSQMDIEHLTIKICDSTSCDIQAFRACILELYVRNTLGNALKEDGEKIDKLLAKLEEIDKINFDKIKNMQMNYLVENLKMAKEIYEN